jgi:hypothetical protein
MLADTKIATYSAAKIHDAKMEPPLPAAAPRQVFLGLEVTACRTKGRRRLPAARGSRACGSAYRKCARAHGFRRS